MKSEVAIEVCEALLREFLEGFRGFPPTNAGIRRFAFAVQQNCISVRHARATLRSFEEVFPTVRQIADVAANLRPQFESSEVDQREEWERKYGKPEAFPIYPKDEIAMHWKAFRDVLYYTEAIGDSEIRKVLGLKERAFSIEFWKAARDRDLDKHADSVAFVRAMIEKHGWPAIMKMDSPPEKMPYVKPPYPPPVSGRKPSGRLPISPATAPVTQADIDRATARRKSTAQVDSELDGWTDPDR